MKRLIAILILAASTAGAATTSRWWIAQFDTNMIFNVNETVGTYGWEDLRFPSSATGTKTPSGDLAIDIAENAITFETGCGTNRLTDDHAWGVAQMPHAWRAGGPISLHVHFVQDNADQTAVWYAYYRTNGLGAAMDTTWKFIGPAVNAFTYTAGTTHQMAVFADVSMIGMEESSIVDWKLFRDGGAGTGDIKYKEFDIHYQVEKILGERFD